MALTAQPIRLHSRVFINKFGHGTVLFVGQTSFAQGVWVGIALDAGEGPGKNDGSVGGKRYFDADPGQGIFVRPPQVEVLSGAEEMINDDDEEEARYQLLSEASQDEDHLLSSGNVSPSAPDSRVPSSMPHIRTSAASVSTPTSNPFTRGGVATSSHTGSPEKTSLRPPSQAAPRPSLMSRSSIASSATSSVGVSSSGRRSLVASPSKSGPSSRGSPAKLSNVNMTRPAASNRTVTSGRASAATSSSTSTLKRAGAESPLVASNSPHVTQPRVAPPGSGTRPMLGRAATASAARPSQSTSLGSSQFSSTSRSGARTSLHIDPQSASAKAGLRTVTKARPSMVAPNLNRHNTVPSSTATNTTPRPSVARSTTPRGLVVDTADPLLSPSAEARKRLNIARLKMEMHAEQQTPSPYNPSEEDVEDLINTSFPDDVDELEEPKAVVPNASAHEINALKRELEELRVRNRLSEKRREEEKGRVKELEVWKAEVAEKLKTSELSMEKAQRLSSEVLSLQTTERELIILKTQLEETVSDLTEQLEMAALDREVAEEKAEAAAAELQDIKQLNEELTLDLELLREENKSYDNRPIDTGEQTSAAFIHLQKQNQRLKDALLKLRDASAETETDQRRRILELEKELSSLADLQDSRDTLLAKLTASEAQLEGIKAQLDDALGAEEMVEQLTERNLFLGERMNEMVATIDELEALKELNEELEEIHLETEKQLQDEVDLKDLTIREWEVRAEALEASAVDHEATFSQFRELVINLQNDLEALKAERDGLLEDGQNASQLNSQSREMLSLNMKLQSSALRSQARTIDTELSRMKAEQASLHLEMLLPYLPSPFAEEGDQDALAGLLFFKRISTKADLIRTILESNHDVTHAIASLSGESTSIGEDGEVAVSPQKVPEHLIIVCQLRHSLAHFAAVCNSVFAMIRTAPPKVFLKCGRMYKEIQAAVEGRVDAFLDALRREELNESDCNANFKRFVRQFEELSYSLMMVQEEEIQLLQEQAEANGSIAPLSYGDGELAAKEVGSATLLELDIDTLTASLFSAKSFIARENITWQLQGQTLEARYLEPLHRLYSDIKATKLLAKKLLRRLTSLASNEEAVSMAAIGDLPSLGRLSSKLVAFATTLDSAVSAYVNETKASGSPFLLTSLLDIVKEAARELNANESDEGRAVNLDGGDAWKEAVAATSYLATTINGLVTAATEQDNVIKISGVAPWQPRSKAIHEIASHNVELERQMLKLQDDLRDLYQQIKARDSALQEGAIKLERMNKKLEKNKSQDEEIEEVNGRLNEVRQQAKAYQDANGVLQAELEALEKEKEALEAKVLASKTQTAGAKDGSPSAGNIAGGATFATEYALHPTSSAIPASHLETNYLLDQLDAMRAVLKHLREENAYLLTQGWTASSCGLAPLVHDRLASDADASLTQSDGAQKPVPSISGLPHKAKLSVPAAEDLRSVASERKSLYSSLLQVAASPKVVVLPSATATSADVSADTGGKGIASDPTRSSPPSSSKDPVPTPMRAARSSKASKVRPWQPSARLPSRQYEAQQALVEELSVRFEKFLERSRRATDLGGGRTRLGDASSIPATKSVMT